MALSTEGSIALAFFGGFIAALLTIMIGTFVFLRKGDAYGLGHWRLNAKMPLTTMWMNLGYWTNYEGKPIQVFQEACATLLREILHEAGLLITSRQDKHAAKSLAVLDLGFGCGDQTFELIRLTQPEGGWDDFRYVGLTLNQSQIEAASRTIYRQAADSETLSIDSFDLFCANAAKPKAWSSRVEKSVRSLSEDKFTQRWLLALDCLYHFQPSRNPIFTFAARELRANAMAFDLVLNEKTSFKNKLAARAIGVIMGCPVRTFLTESQYRHQLVECGYDSDSIIIKDISEHVFSGVSDFIINQERALSQYGISMGGYKLAGRLFKWFGESQVVKAVIVVAKVKG